MQVSIVWMILTIIIIVAAIVTGLTLLLLRRNCLKNNLGMYLDAEATKKTGVMTITIINANKYPDIWEASESELSMEFLGRNSGKFRFEKNEEMLGTYKIFHSESYTALDVVSIVGGMKYKKTFITINGGQTKFYVRSIKVKSIKTMEEKFKKQTQKINMKTKKTDSITRLKNRMERSDAEFYLGISQKIDNEKIGGILCHSVESKATKTSIRHQLYVPAEHPFRKEMEALKDKVKFYHAYNGYLYEIETHYIGANGEVHKWELVGLEPGLMYVGLSYSLDGGKTIYASSAVYGTTRKENGELPVLDDAHLAHPKVGLTKHKMWNKSEVIDMYGAAFARVYFALIAKKHRETDVSNSYISIHDAACETSEETGARCLCLDYTWLKTPITEEVGQTFSQKEYDEAVSKIQKEETHAPKVIKKIEGQF